MTAPRGYSTPWGRFHTGYTFARVLGNRSRLMSCWLGLRYAITRRTGRYRILQKVTS